MHGGLFKRDDVKLDELRTIDRNRQPGEEGIYPHQKYIQQLLVLSFGRLLKLVGTAGTHFKARQSSYVAKHKFIIF